MPDNPLPRVFVQAAWSKCICTQCGPGEPPHRAEFWVTRQTAEGQRQTGCCDQMLVRVIREGLGSVGFSVAARPPSDVDDEAVTEVGRKRPPLRSV